MAKFVLAIEYNATSVFRTAVMTSSRLPIPPAPQPNISAKLPPPEQDAQQALLASPLGKAAGYVDVYSPDLLFSIGRAGNRARLSAGTNRPAMGADIWTAFELSWLNEKGKPVVATATITVPADSPNIIESKSMKLYFNSLNQSRFPNTDTVVALIRRDLSQAAGAHVAVDLYASGAPPDTTIVALAGELLDDLDISFDQFSPDATLLRCGPRHQPHTTLVSHLLKSNCPVTGQPDWASVQIAYSGQEIDRAQLLRYIVSFRQHAGFHEHCVETIFDDIMRVCRPDVLTVYARYTRRGGLDINPWRSTAGAQPPANLRTPRQ